MTFRNVRVRVEWSGNGERQRADLEGTFLGEGDQPAVIRAIGLLFHHLEDLEELERRAAGLLAEADGD